MVYYTHLDVLERHPKRRYVAQQLKDEEGLFWQLVGVFSQSNGSTFGDLVIAVDILDELRVWCDLNNVKIHHKEKYEES